MEASERAAQAARTSYGRLLALLAARTRDIAAAEDALADAFERALLRWPLDGVPTNPDGWLLTVARNRLKDHWKSAAQRLASDADPDEFDEPATALDPDAIEDRRLELLLVCAHPAIDRGIHTALMLNTVLGCTAEQIGAAMAVPTSTLASRLVRAKRRIKQTGIRFRIPDRSVLPARIDAVLSAVYGAYAIDWSSGPEERSGLEVEARQLAEITAELTGDPEAYGLAALICFSRARWPARRDRSGRMVPLAEQDSRRWDRDLIVHGRELLATASRAGQLGPHQVEAAIQALHCARLDDPGHRVDPTLLVRLHRTRHELSPDLGSAVALAAAVEHSDGAEQALVELDALLAGLVAAGIVDRAQVRRFQPGWATRAHLLHRLDRTEEAVEALDTAIGMTHAAADRDHLHGLRSQWTDEAVYDDARHPARPKE
ncbi:MAG TPA: RNA polymerase subunit sigma-70 [Candidatus Avipropionibacterium avicola]|uniref:RNA polymerase subunit sigma-70 n=1 Tax=Candidatus Avipropionibacterium avicola TaxID=2840701 RepID=A0A9D1GYK3_9ACTN|nr:RNA polymerase subunit sigma-70 [Candidatus Avipropionibacterium avicola]